MKKKLFIIPFIIIFVLFSLIKKDNIIIPEDAIRLRVIANSNSSYDQELKNMVKTDMEIVISNKLKNVETVNDARNILEKSVEEVETRVGTLLDENNIDINYNVNYGYNYFPEKKYNGVIYKEGEYESLVITLGEGLGNNWWCVLFPPLCLIDAEEDYNSNETEYRFLIKDLIDKYF